MANTKISALAELAETPASNDLYLVVDVSDTTMSSTGTNKYIQALRIVHKDLSGNVVGINNLTAGGTITMGSVGIGTVTPAVRCHILTTGEGIRLQNTSATGNTNLTFSQISTRRANIGHEDTDDAAFLSSWYGDVVFRAAATAGANTPTEYVRIKSGGRVGIGTGSPNNQLEVVGTVQMDALRLDQTPTAGAVTLTHYVTVNLNGTTYRIPCGTA